MKKILIVGEHSYIGGAFRDFLKRKEDDYSITVVSSRNNQWQNVNFGEYDAILHVAGIAHVNAEQNMEQLYYQVNRDLTISCCKKAKEDGARQFVFLSSIIVYGESKSLIPMVIGKDTKPCPNGFYGQSKLEAEEGIMALKEEDFAVAVIRPPMVYGKGSKGNYPKLAKLAKICPIFPDLKNQRSMIHIAHLCKCIELVIERRYDGIVCPQNKEYVSTTQLVKEIGKCHKKKIFCITILNPLIRILAKKINFLNKVYGSLVYEKGYLDPFREEYQLWTFPQTIEKTEQ